MYITLAGQQNMCATHSVFIYNLSNALHLLGLISGFPFRSLVLWSAGQSCERPKNLPALCRCVCVLLFM